MEHQTISPEVAEKVRDTLRWRSEARKAAAKMKTYPDGQFVALEQKQCIVCGNLYETGNLLMDTPMRNVFKNKYACTGLGLCPEHQKYVDDGYVICIEVKNQPKEEGEVMKPEDADRTGNLCFMKKEAAREVFNMPLDSPIVYFGVGVIEKLKGIFKDSVREMDDAEAKTEEASESAV